MKPYYKLCIGLGIVAAALVISENVLQTLVFVGLGLITRLLIAAVKK